MVNISKLGDSTIKFTFTDNDRYLYNGEITLPMNSLILEFDTSDLVIFKKIDGDVFVTFLLENSNFDSKDSLIEFYKTSMVGSTSGGGGVTSGEVQTMIDESISGKADSSDVYTTGQTSGATEIANALNAKLDATAYTPTVVDAALSQSSTNPVQNQALYSELRISNGGETETTLVIENNQSINYPSGCTKLKVEVVGSNNYSNISFFNANQNLGTIDIFNYGSISVDNSYFQAATYEISGTTVIITYPASLGVIRIVLDGDNNSTWSFKAIVETPAVPLKDVVNGLEPKVDAAWENGVKAPSLGYDTISGITLSSLPISGGNYNYSSIATDDSLKSDNESVLGVYATGDTYVVSINPAEKINVANLGADKKPFNIKMYWNSSYTGNTSHYIAVNCIVNDDTNGYCQWNWKNGEYVPNTNYINTAVTLTYDSTNQVVTITPSSSSALTSIRYVRCSRYIAPSSALTQDDCRIGLVTIDTNSYKLQEALDNKADTSALGGLNLVKLTESDYQSLSVKDPDTLYVVIPDPTNP